MRLLIGISQPAGDLINLYVVRVCRKRKRYHSFISKLLFHFGKINGPFVDTGWCSCLKTKHFDPICLQGICQMIRCLESVWSCIIADITVYTSCLQISSCTQYTGLTVIYCTGKCLHSGENTVLYDNLSHFCLFNRQIRRIFQCFSHAAAVVFLVCLGSQ